MPAVKFSPIGNDSLFLSGVIASGAKLFFYEAGTSTKQNTYTTSAGSIANSNPIVLNSNGRPATEVWLIEGSLYKIVLAPSTDTDPPSSGITLADNVGGINDTFITLDQWQASGITPTYVSSTSFTVSGDETSTLHVGRRLKSTVTGGTAYSTITASSYSAPNTTITVVNDSTALDAGMSAFSYGVLTTANPSLPKFVAPDGSTAVTQAYTDNTTKLATTAFVQLNKHNSVQDFRLTLTSNTPVTTGDVTGATTIYAAPYTGNKIGLYNGSTWDLVTSAQFSLALGTLTSDLPYDVFAYNNSGTATLEFTAWTNTSTRATDLAYQDGVLCKTGALTRRYLGTFHTTSTTETEDSITKRYLFNYYYRKQRQMAVLGGSTWNYTTATWRQANASSTNQLNFVVGVLEDTFSASLVSHGASSSGGTKIANAIGLNTTSSVAFTPVCEVEVSAANDQVAMNVNAISIPALGKNYLSWMEWSTATGTTTFIGQSGQAQSALTGFVLA